MKTFGLRLIGFPKITVVKNLTEKSCIFVMDSEGFYEALLSHECFFIYKWLTMKQQTFKFFFEICMKMHFVSLFFLNKRNCNLTFDVTFKMNCWALC